MKKLIVITLLCTSPLTAEAGVAPCSVDTGKVYLGLLKQAADAFKSCLTMMKEPISFLEKRAACHKDAQAKERGVFIERSSDAISLIDDLDSKAKNIYRIASRCRDQATTLLKDSPLLMGVELYWELIKGMDAIRDHYGKMVSQYRWKVGYFDW